MGFKRYRTSSGAHVTIAESFAKLNPSKYEELPSEDALDANGKPMPTTHPTRVPLGETPPKPTMPVAEKTSAKKEA